jgi:predicted PurR-regulated permease PerM
MQNNRWLQTLIILLVIIASAWLAAQVWGFLLQFSNIILLFFLSWLLAFVLRPLARALTARGMPYGLAVAVVYLALAFLLTIGGILLVPVISQQIQQLIDAAPAIQQNADQLLTQAQGILADMGVKTEDLNRIATDLVGQAQTALMAILQNAFNVLQGVATLALQVIFIFLISFYLMKDGDRLSSGVLRMLPSRWEDEIRLISLSVEKSFGGFIRGQVVFALVYGVLTAIIMMVPPFQLDYVVVASLVAGFCMIIPLVGNFLAYVPPLLVCVITKPELWLWLLLALFIAQSFMMNFLGPRIMSSAIGLHPIYVVAAMLVGGQVAGVWGALFGIPIAGTMNLVGRPLLRRLRHQMPIYQDTGMRSLPTSAFVTGPLAAQMVKSMQTGALPEIPTEAPSIPSTTQATTATTPESAHAAFEDMEQDADMLVRRSPTLTARAWRLIIVAGSRAVNWAWSRARREASR